MQHIHLLSEARESLLRKEKMEKKKELTELQKVLQKPKPLGHTPEAHRAYIAEIVATGDKKVPYVVEDYIQQ